MQRLALVVLLIAAVPAAGAQASGLLDAVGDVQDQAPAVPDGVPSVDAPQLVRDATGPLRILDPAVNVAAPPPPPGPARPPPSPASSFPPAVAATAGAASLLFVLAWIMGGLDLLRSAFGASLFSRIHESDLLRNPIRARIRDVVAASPGLSISEIRDRVDAAWGTVVRHLRRMERHGLLVSQRGATGRVYLLAQALPAPLRVAYAATLHPTARRIAEFVHAHPGIDQTTVCAALGLRNPAASKHLGRFESLGLVEARFDLRRRVYTPTPRLAFLLHPPA